MAVLGEDIADRHEWKPALHMLNYPLQMDREESSWWGFLEHVVFVYVYECVLGQNRIWFILLDVSQVVILGVR